jgi:hypothetical protein
LHAQAVAKPAATPPPAVVTTQAPSAVHPLLSSLDVLTPTNCVIKMDVGTAVRLRHGLPHGSPALSYRGGLFGCYLPFLSPFPSRPPGFLAGVVFCCTLPPVLRHCPITSRHYHHSPHSPHVLAHLLLLTVSPPPPVPSPHPRTAFSAACQFPSLMPRSPLFVSTSPGSVHLLFSYVHIYMSTP